MPPRVASAPGSIGKNRPESLISRLSCMRVTPACTVTVRSSGLSCSTRSMRETSTLTPPCTASRWPSSDEPAPYGITGTRCPAAHATTKATSSVLSQNTTASGGGTSNGDSSRPCCSRTASAVTKRSRKRARKASAIAAGIARGITFTGKSTPVFMAAPGVHGGSRARVPDQSTPRSTLPPMANRLSQIATRTGDDGTTGLGDGTRVPKSHGRIAAMGDVDELNSHIGVLLAEPLPDDVRELLVMIQHELFNLGGELSIPGYSLLKDDAVAALDAALTRYNETLPRLAAFILPAGTRSAALAHVARAVARRAQRAVVTLAAGEAVNAAPRLFLNRLSDLLFVLARVLNRANLDGLGGDDVYWKSEKLSRNLDPNVP